MPLPSNGQPGAPSEPRNTADANSPQPGAGDRDAGAPSHFVYFRLALVLFAIVAGTEGCLTLQAAKNSLQTTAGLLAFLAAAILIGTAIVFEPLRALMRRRR